MIRLLSGLALAAGALAAIFFLPSPALRLLACAVAALAAHEYLGIVQARRPVPGTVPLLLLVVITAWWMFEPSGGRLLTLLLAALAWVAVEVVFRGLTIDQAAARFFAAWYVGMPLGMLAGVHTLGGRMATLLLIATVVVSDTAQYYSGRLLGRRPLAPAISPGKTIEGAVGGILMAGLFMTLAGPWVLSPADSLSLAALGVALSGLGIWGDLFESRLKRHAGVKDSSALIPGHGGVLDRIDALLFATPAYYLFLRA